jgi:N-acetylglucosamine malate deacetylase 1
MKKNVLVLAPHPDDGELGCGGTINKFINYKYNIYYMAFSLCEESIPKGYPSNVLLKELKNATKVLGINKDNVIMHNFPVRRFNEYRQEILELLVSFKNNIIVPDIIFLPSSFDVHQDHIVIHEEGKRAFKNSCLLGYEFAWNNFSFNTGCFILLDENNIMKKISALNKYKSQSSRFYNTKSIIKSLAIYRGLQINNKYSEAFEIIRWIII